jgi:DNA polymerase-3 subunit epsilon
LALDLETTDWDPLVARVVSFAAVRVLRSGQVQPILSGIVDPGVEVSAEAEAIHGISSSYARAVGMPHTMAMDVLCGIVRQAWTDGECVCVFNAPYDLTVIDRGSTGGLGTPGLVIDPLVLSRRIEDGVSHTLTDVARRYGVPLRNAHNADDDAIAAGLIMFAMWPQIVALLDCGDDGNDLMQMQARLTAEFHRQRGGFAGWPLVRNRELTTPR